MRQRAAESDVVIVNHHLLCADAAVRQSAYGEVIPACTYAIVDEAHQLEDVATQYFGIAVSNYRVDDLRPRRRRALGANLVPDPRPGGRRCRTTSSGVRDACARRSSPTAADDAASRRRATGGSRRARDPHRPVAHAEGRRRGSRAGTRARGASKPTSRSPERRARGRARARRAGPAELREGLGFLLRADDPGYVYFVESAAAASSCAPRRSTSRPSSASCCSIACDDGADVGDADRRRLVRLHARPARHPATPTKSGSPRSSTSRARRSCICRERMPDPRSPRVRGRGRRAR